MLLDFVLASKLQNSLTFWEFANVNLGPQFTSLIVVAVITGSSSITRSGRVLPSVDLHTPATGPTEGMSVSRDHAPAGADGSGTLRLGSGNNR